jgi:hypothetical protein
LTQLFLTFNRLKDCDVTWLYGPLQIGSYKSLGEIALTGGVQSRPPRPNSPVPKKTSLKKRSMSEMMLQRSLSSSSLLKQAAAAVQAQRSVRTSGSWKAIAPHMGESPRLLTSLSSPELTSPCVERNTRNVRFHEQVEQCIAVDLASNYSDDDDLEEPQPAKYNYFSDSNYDSDEGLIMMVKSKYIRGPRPVVEPKLQFTPSMRYLIETLPCTLLKSRDEDPRPPTQSIRRSGKLSSYPSQETHQPINPSARIVLEVNAEDEEEFDWFSPSTFSSKFSCKLESDNQRADPLPNNSVPPSLELSRKLKSDIEMKAPKDEKTCSKCSLQTIPSWRNCDMCPECIRTLVLDDSEYDDPTLTSFSRAATTWERAPTTEDSSQDIALVASSWTEESASTTLDDFSPNGSDLVSFALPLRFARSVGLPYTDPGNSLAELGESGPKNEIASEGPEECEAEGESRFQASSEYYSSEPDNTGSDNGAYHGLCDISNGQSETDLAPILGPMKQALVNRIMEEFWAIFNQGPDSRYIGCAGNTPESSAPSSAISSPNSSSVKPSQRKRRRDDDDERPPDDNNDRKPRQPRSGQPSTLDPEENKRFACPFRKHDSRKYSVYNHRACALSHWETISRVK